MPATTDILLKQVSATTVQIDYRTPIKFGGRVVNDVVLLNVAVEVETHDGKRATGEGSMPIGNVWAWPSNNVSADESFAAMKTFGLRVAQSANECQTAGHPIEITHQFATSYDGLAKDVIVEHALGEPMPTLAQMVAASPFEAAIHDAFGKVHDQNSYDLLGADYCNADLSQFLNDDFRGEYLDAYTLRSPKPSMPLYHLVGALDPLAEGDISTRINDGLPETLGEWILADGLTHLKIKLNGEDLDWDVERVANIEMVSQQAQAKRNCQEWFYSLDFNEKCENVQYILDFLARLQEQSASALERVQYIEQPTHRDLRANPENRMHEAAQIKPVVIDESLVDFETLLLAREQGYSGVALKACKGQTEALLMGAAAQKYNLFLCVQDLTCVGRSFLHSASLAARIPTVAAIEGNGRQYCPAGNEGWNQQFPGMFNISTGTVQTSELAGHGLGY
ncbi:MAG: mandelate racemase/muconate lactonizing enzyme family protein [Pirellulaceae bacterium]|nr:mandelate racemase/muconate lactonizing enzyme family protein [Pirellulaceae bacterium]